MFGPRIVFCDRHYLNLTCHPTPTREVPRARPLLWLNVKHPLIKFNPKTVQFSHPCLIYYFFLMVEQKLHLAWWQRVEWLALSPHRNSDSDSRVHQQRENCKKTLKTKKSSMKNTESDCSGYFSLFLTLSFTSALCTL